MPDERLQALWFTIIAKRIEQHQRNNLYTKTFVHTLSLRIKSTFFFQFPKGSVLVFLQGFSDIQTLLDLLHTSPVLGYRNQKK